MNQTRRADERDPERGGEGREKRRNPDDAGRDPGAVSEGACRNCGTPLQGRFCVGCGQDAAPAPTVGRFIRELAGDLLDLDSRFARTLRGLLHPGHLPGEWYTGRRVRYLPPVRLYLFASVLFFFLMATAPRGIVQIEAAGQRAGPGSGRGGVAEGVASVWT